MRTYPKKRKKSNKLNKLKNSNKKALGVGEVFVFIIAAITFALIMIFGYKSITEFMAKGENVEFYQFKTNLESSIQKIYSEYGAVRVERFKTPARYEQICFVDLDSPYDESLCEKNQIACDVWKEVAGGEEESRDRNRESGATSGYEGADENVFLKPVAPTKIKVQKIGIAPKEEGEEAEEENGGNKNYLCLKIINGAFSLMLEGKGDRTELSSG